MNVVLIGFMATGKTTVAQLLGKRLGWGTFDTDRWVEQKARSTVAEIFSHQGEAAFRTLESEAVKIAAELDETVVSTGGGAPMRAENMAALKANGYVVALSASPDAVLERLKKEPAVRPLLAGQDPAKAVRELMAARQTSYLQAHRSVATDGKTPEQVADEIFKLVKERKP